MEQGGWEDKADTTERKRHPGQKEKAGIHYPDQNEDVGNRLNPFIERFNYWEVVQSHYYHASLIFMPYKPTYTQINEGDDMSGVCSKRGNAKWLSEEEEYAVSYFDVIKRS